MSLEMEDHNSAERPGEFTDEYYRKSKISYTREFLLSLSELDVCKTLPSGFDLLLLSEFEDASQDRPGFSMHNFRRIEYGSCTPNRGEVNNYSKGPRGRWDSRFGQSDRDNDTQSDQESDFGSQFGNQSHRSCQVPEHDGLLGCGSFPRPPGYTPGLSKSKFQSNNQNQLNRSNEPYHPPRPYKAIPHARQDNKDLYNDETFGSSECTSEGQAEEERKRRDSFELMRKEQHKAFQERQKWNLDYKQNDFDITSLMDDPKDDKSFMDKVNDSVRSVSLFTSDNVSARSLPARPSNGSRPLVPPGFSNTNLVARSTMTHETEENKEEGIWSPQTFQSSKFTQCFKEDGGNGEKGSGQISDVRGSESNLLHIPFQGSKAVRGDVTKGTVPHLDGHFKQLYNNDKQEVASKVITCEDLEQSMLSGLKDDGSATLEPAQDRAFDVTAELSSANIDDHASQHLLFLLHKGPSQKDVIPPSGTEVRSYDKVHNASVPADHAYKSGEGSADVSKSFKTLTLETFFGSALMKDLQSVGAPVSIPRDSTRSARINYSDPPRFILPVADPDVPALTEEIGTNRQGSKVLVSDQVQHKEGKIEEGCLGYDDPHIEQGSSPTQREFSMLSTSGCSADIWFPKEDTLITVNDPMQKLIPGFDPCKTDDPADNLAPMHSPNQTVGPNNGVQGAAVYPPGPCDLRNSEVSFQNCNAQLSYQLNPSVLNHMGQMFDPLDSFLNTNPHMKFMSADNMIRNSSPPNHFQGNVLHPPFNLPSPGLAGFDAPVQHPVMQRLSVPANVPPHHLTRGFPGIGPFPSHSNNTVTGFIKEPNSMQGFPSGHQQPTIGGPGMAFPASKVGGLSHPEALKKLIEMDLRSNSKPIHHLASVGGHNQRFYSQELELGVGYR